MKRLDFLILSYLLLQSVPSAAGNINVSVPKASKPVLSVLQKKSNYKNGTQDIYAYPFGLSCLGIYSSEDQPVCNYLSPNRLINKNYFLWAPLDKPVTYISNVSDVAAYSWTMPGTLEETSTSSIATATYKTLGHYQFPSLELTTTSGEKSMYQAEGEILVSGKAEITTANCRKWGETYQLGYLPLNGGSAGYLGGTNSANLNGYGNLFMTAHGNAHLTGVNVYFAFKPTKYPEDAKLLLRVWYPMETEEGMELTGLPLEVVELPVSAIRDAYEGEFPVKNVAVGEFRFEEPLQIWDKPLFFVTVEGFGDDPSKSDIVMLTEVMGQDIPENQMTNMLAHNSFVNYNNMGYNMPINYFGASPGASFMICPLVDNQDGDATNISSLKIAKNETKVSANALSLNIYNPDATSISIINACGMKIGEWDAKDKGVNVKVPCIGIYLIQIYDNEKIIDVKKVVVDE